MPTRARPICEERLHILVQQEVHLWHTLCVTTKERVQKREPANTVLEMLSDMGNKAANHKKQTRAHDQRDGSKTTLGRAPAAGTLLWSLVPSRDGEQVNSAAHLAWLELL